MRADLAAASEAYIYRKEKIHVPVLRKDLFFFFFSPNPSALSCLDLFKACNNSILSLFSLGFVGGFIMNSGLETFNSL